MKVLAAGGDRDAQFVAIDIYRRLKGPSVAAALAAIAALSPWDDVRAQAGKLLQDRDQDIVVATLIDLFRDPLRYDVRHVGGPGSPGGLFVEGETFNLQLVFAPPPLPTINLQPGDFVADAFGLPAVYRPPNNDSVRLEISQMPAYERLEVRNDCTEIPVGRMALQTRNAAVVSQAQLENNIADIQRFNLRVGQINTRVGDTLRAETGKNLGDDREAWRGWWFDKLGYSHESPSISRSRKPTYFQTIQSAYQAPSMDGFNFNPVSGYSFGHGTCFVAGTPVHTREGLKPMETIRVGDMVLSRTSRQAPRLSRRLRQYAHAQNRDLAPDPLQRRNHRRHPAPPLLDRRQRLDDRSRP